MSLCGWSEIQWIVHSKAGGSLQPGKKGKQRWTVGFDMQVTSHMPSWNFSFAADVIPDEARADIGI